MPIDEILSHPYDLSCWWDVKSQINQPTEHVTIQLVYVGTRKYIPSWIKFKDFIYSQSVSLMMVLIPLDLQSKQLHHDQASKISPRPVIIKAWSQTKLNLKAL